METDRIFIFGGIIMRKTVKAMLMAACICTTPLTAFCTAADTVCAYSQLIASLREVSVFKDTLAIGETAQLELTWSNGAHPEVTFTSSDEKVAAVDQDGLVTGVSDGTATITVSHSEGKVKKTIDISVSGEAEKSVVYNTSELSLGDKVKKYDTLHYDGKRDIANIVNTKGSYDVAFLNEKDYILPFDAEIVGIDAGIVLYIAPDIEGITYLDGRTLNVGDVIDRNTHLLCYDYYIKSAKKSVRLIHPVFLPEYYGKYIGDGEIRVSMIDHVSKTIELESVPVVSAEEKKLDVQITSKPYDTVIHGESGPDLCGLRMTVTETDGNGKVTSQLENVTIEEAREKYDVKAETKDDVPGSGICQISVSLKDENIGNSASFRITYGAPVVKGDVNSDGELNVSDVVLVQKWLLAVPDTALSDWNRADIYRDGQLDVMDLCLMKGELLKKQ